MMHKNTSKTSPIILIDRSSDPYLEPEQPILLHQNGDISCNGIFLKNTPRTRYFRDYYEMMLDYLTGKKMRLNVTYFRKKDLGDVIEEMQSNNDKTISLKKLIEIYSYENQIADMRNIAIEQISKTQRKRWWRQRNLALDKGDYKTCKEMQNQFEEKSEIANDIINLRR